MVSESVNEAARAEGREISSSPEFYDEDKAARLWTLSEELVGSLLT